MKPRMIVLFVVLVVGLTGQQSGPPEREIPLYRGVAPGSENWNWSETQTTSPTGMPYGTECGPTRSPILPR